MVLYLLIFLLAIPVSLATGVLLALLLREIHARHPLPLVEPGYVNAWLHPETKINIADSIKVQETTDEPVADGATDTGDIAEEVDAELVDTENASFQSGISVFDGSGIIPKDLPVSAALNSMTATGSAVIPNELEYRIEESTRLKDGLPQEVRSIRDDLDCDDLEDLSTVLPKAKIDFTQEFETDPEVSETISPMAKELLGEDFDFDTLEQQSQRASADIALDVQTDDTGTVQVSSPFLFADSPQLADFAVPQTVLSAFSGDWIQESGSVIAPAGADASIFCFTEESQPMFVRKKKAN